MNILCFHKRFPVVCTLLAIVDCLTPKNAFCQTELSPNDARLANSLIAQVKENTHSLTSLSGTLTVKYTRMDGQSSSHSGSVIVERPNLALFQVDSLWSSVFSTIASNGATLYQFTPVSNPDGKAFREIPADELGKNITFPDALPLIYFFHSDQTFNSAALSPVACDIIESVKYVGNRDYNNVRYDVIEEVVSQPAPVHERFYIGADKLLHRVEIEFASSTRPDELRLIEEDLTNVTINDLIPKSRFNYLVPSDVRPFVSTNLNDQLLQVGAVVPQISLPSLKPNQTIVLYDLIRSKKTILIDFWFVNCLTCRQEFPELQRIYQRFKDQGLVIVGVNALDDAASVTDAMGRLPALGLASFPIVLTGPHDSHGVLRKFKVLGYPTAYLVNQDGKIVYAVAGYDPVQGLSSLELALKKLGFR